MKTTLRQACKRAYQLYLKLANEKEKIAESNDVTKSTMSITSFNYFLTRYTKILADAHASLNGKDHSKKAKKISSLIEDISAEIRNLLAQNLFRIFAAKRNIHFHPNTLQEIPEVVERIENEFYNDVIKAVEFFGKSFLNFKFENLGAMAWQLPKTIQEMLDSPERSDWKKHDYYHGYPQALFLEMYNNVLRSYCEKYIIQQEKNK